MLRPHELNGVFLGSHAVAAGMITKKQLTLFRRLLQNVYADPALPAEHELFARGAALLLPSDGVLAGRSAACWYGAPFASEVDPVRAIVPPGSAWRGPRGVLVHRTSLRPVDSVVVDDLPLTTPVRTAWDVATLETVPTAVALLDGMVRQGYVGEAQLGSMLVEMRGRWRHARVEKVFALVDGRSESPPESWVRVACVRAGLPMPTPQFVVMKDGEFLGKVDLAWPEARVVVEYEGAYHFDGVQIVKDDARYERLIAAGWRVIRVSAADLRDLEVLVQRIADALASPRIAG